MKKAKDAVFIKKRGISSDDEAVYLCDDPEYDYSWQPKRYIVEQRYSIKLFRDHYDAQLFIAARLVNTHNHLNPPFNIIPVQYLRFSLSPPIS